MTTITVEEAMARKRDLERELRDTVSARLLAFEEQTGLPVQDLVLEFVSVQRLCDERPRRLLRNAAIEVCL